MEKMSNWKNKKVLITGAYGLLGKPLVKLLRRAGAQIIAPTSIELDLCNQKQVLKFFNNHLNRKVPGQSNISCVFHLAAKVGGVKGNMDNSYDFFTDNIKMNTNVLDAAKETYIPKVVSVLSTCVYPDSQFVSYPLTEEQLHNGPPHASNFAYAFAKRMLEVQSRAFVQQFPNKGSRVCVIPNNLFGEYDNFDLENGHVIPALIRKIWEAKISKKPEVHIWGDGSPIREFTYAEDIAKILLMIGELYDSSELLNIGNTQGHTILSVAENIANLLDYKGSFAFDATKPNGQYEKPSSNEKLLEYTCWKNEDYTPFDVALKNTCSWFVSEYPNIRGIKKI